MDDVHKNHIFVKFAVNTSEAKESKKTITKRESEKMKNVPELDEPL